MLMPPTVVGARGYVSCDMGRQQHRWIERAEPMWLLKRNLVSPSRSCQGTHAARPADSAAGTGGRRKRMSVCKRPERGCPHRGT